jgi:hypothetical protein
MRKCCEKKAVSCVVILHTQPPPRRGLRQYEPQIVEVAPGQYQRLTIEVKGGRRRYQVNIRLPKGRWTKLPAKGADCWIETPSKNLSANLMRCGQVLLSSQFRDFYSGRYVKGGYSVQIRPQTAEELKEQEATIAAEL